LLAVPHSILFFLGGREQDLHSAALPGLGVTPLPPLPEGEDFRFIAQYKRLMDIVAPRSRSRVTRKRAGGGRLGGVKATKARAKPAKKAPAPVKRVTPAASKKAVKQPARKKVATQKKKR
jgi:hypothetical protein